MKKVFMIIVFAITTMMLCGCSIFNSSKSISTAYTSVYPVEYILESLYGSDIAIYSIYPDGTNYNDYKLSNKQLNDYSKVELFVYNSSIDKEKDYAVEMLNKNKDLKIIDASLGMKTSYSKAEVWLNPANYLMMASNIKNGLDEYVNEKITISKTINKNYSSLKLKLSSLDAELKDVASNANDPVIIVSNDMFKFLEKYGFTVYSLGEESELSEKTISEVEKVLKNKKTNYIYMVDNEKQNSIIKKYVEKYDLKTLSLNSLSTLNAEDRKNKKDYMSIMEDNISSIRLSIK